MRILTLHAPDTPAGLQRALGWAGAVLLGAFVLLAPLSYAVAAVSPFGLHQEPEASSFLSALSRLPVPALAASEFVQQQLTGDSLLAVAWVRTVAVMTPLLVATAAAASALWLLARGRHLVTERTITLITRVAVVVGIVSALSYPMFTQDMWVSVVWGRMLLDGVNPYYEFFSESALEGTPLVGFPIRMTYGPLWAWWSAGIAGLGGGDAIRTFVVWKAMLLACWLGMLWLIRAILSAASPARRAAALCFAGWWPVSAHFAVGEAHNDIVMVVLLVLWLYMHVRRIPWAILALAASVLVKYVTAPLLVIEAWQAWMNRRRQPWAYAIWGGMAVALTAALTLPLWRGANILAPALEMQGWHFLTPAHALTTVLHWADVPASLEGLDLVGGLVFGSMAVHAMIRLARGPDEQAVFSLALALMCFVLFAGVGHGWPWYLVWVVPLVAVHGSGVLWRLTVCAAAAAPFLDIVWLLPAAWDALPVAGVAYFGSIAVLSVLPLNWRALEWGRWT